MASRSISDPPVVPGPGAGVPAGWRRGAAWAAGLTLALGLAGCDMLGIDTPEKKQADGKAIGAACRHAGRAIEDCYTLNAKGDKAAIYAGWREMDDYMRENKIEPVAPVIKPEDLLPKPKPPKPKAKPKPEAAEGGAVEGGTDGAAQDEGASKRAKPTH